MQEGWWWHEQGILLMSGRVIWTPCICGLEKDSRAKVCRQCHASALTAKTARVCPSCGTPFFKKKQGNLLRFCSRACSTKWKTGRPAKNPRPKQEPRPRPSCSVAGCCKPSRRSASMLCAAHLWRLRRHGSLNLAAKEGPTAKSCESCGVKFFPKSLSLQHLRQKYCSRVCMGKAYREAPVSCLSCGKSFFSQRRSGSAYCSRRCAYTSATSKKSGLNRREIWNRMGMRLRGRPATYPMRRFYYRDVPFRSSWEVRAAKALDVFGIKWEYESRRFDLGTETYAPDFYLPDDNAFWEVKGYFGPKSQRTVSLFRKLNTHPLVLIGAAELKLLERAAETCAQKSGAAA